jgi:outer membrane protein insertion porin family
MAGARITPTRVDRICLAVMLAALVLGGSLVYSQAAPTAASSASDRPGPLLPDTIAGHSSDARSPDVPTDARPVDAASSAPADQEMVAQVRVTGNGKIPLEKILPHIHTRAGRPFNAELIEEDVRRLNSTHMFVQVKPYSQKTQGGRVVIFEVLERPMLHYIKYVGNVKVKKKHLEKEAGIKPGDSLDTFAVEEARRRIEEYYHSHGFPKARVTIFEGNKSSDRGAIFVINEGQKQRVLWTDFVGNTIASDRRLLTQIQTKPGFLWVFKGEVDRKQIDEDINRLTGYYRSLGFFAAEVGRELHFSESENWLRITYVINEGPRYRVRNVSFKGNTKFSTEELAAKTKLKGGQYFNQSEMSADRVAIEDTYGSVGHVFAKIQAEPRYLEEPGTLDLVYSIQEGEPFRVGRINVKIKGEFPHTRITTVLNRMTVRPGDIVDTRKLRDSERRLRACGLFEVDPAGGVAPKIAFSAPDGDTEIARKPKPSGNVRGQSPDPPTITIDTPPNNLRYAPGERSLDLTIEGTALGGAGTTEPPEVEQNEPSPPSPAAQASAARQDLDAPLHAAESALAAQLAQPPVVRPQASYNFGVQNRAPVPSDLAPVTPRPTRIADPQFQRAHEALERLVSEPRPEAVAGAADRYPIQRAQYAAPEGVAAPVRPVSESFAPQQPAPPRTHPSEAPLRGDFGRPTQPCIIRGQGPDTGRSIPHLSRGLGSSSKTPLSFTSGTAQPSQTIPPPTGTTAPYTTPAQSYWPAPAAPAVANQVSPAQPYSPPIDQYNVAPLTSAGPTIADAEPLFGNPPDQQLLPLTLEPSVTEARTGRLMFSVGFNSDAGLLGSVILDEQNFDWTKLPTSWDDIRNGTAWRGNGQRFRAEAVPGTELQRYTVSFQDPYLFDTQVSLGLSGFYYDRQFTEWTEQRIGGRVSLGYQLAPDLSATVAFRGASVTLSDPIFPTPPMLQEALGQSSLYGFEFSLARDTRDSQFLPTEGSLIEASVEQVIGTFEYPRFNLDMRKYFMIAQRPDGSGRQVLSVSGRLSITGDDTPIYEHYFAGGFSTLRGFDFRGASPRQWGVLVGGEFMTLASAEYMFPMTADDMIRGVVFVDTGTVEPKLDDWSDRYRVSAGFGLRITIPAMGPAPIALDFAVPIVHEQGDDIENFSFFVGFLR